MTKPNASIFKQASALYVGHAHNEDGTPGPLELGMEVYSPFGVVAVVYELEPGQLDEILTQMRMAESLRLTCKGPDNHGGN